jgi:hypothetical protein
MKTLIVLWLSCASVFGAETLIPLKSGETNHISYGLSCLVSDSRSASNAPVGENLVLVLRNDGAKWINLEGATVKNFSLHDANGQEMKIYLRTAPRGMAYGEPNVIQLLVDKAAEAPQPWTLHFECKDAFTVVDLKITDINPQKH